MEEKGYVSTARAAQALGVSVSTVKRWVDDGVLPAHKTAGGHRKLLLADLLRLARESALPHCDLRQLAGLPALSSSGMADGPRARRLLDRLRRGDVEGAEALLREAYLGGLEPGALADRVVGPAMSQLGEDWACGRADVFHEHRASQTCTEAILGLKRLIESRAESSGPLAVGASPEGHWHTLANRLAELVLRDLGWRVVDLGANTPLASLRLALRELRPRLVWLSVNDVADPGAFLGAYAPLADDCQRSGVALAVGGRGLTEALRGRMAYTTHGDGLSHLASFARSLHPPPRAPRPGRPPRGRG